MNKRRVLVIGLDSAPPELLFNKFLEDLPNVKKLARKSIHGPMRTCVPAITIPAWMVMATGKTPGELGVYGFRHRKDNSYNDIYIANSTSIKEKKIWDFLGEKGYKSIIVGVPPSYPPYKVNGHMVSCFITPDASCDYTYPKELKKEIERLVGEYVFDVVFRTDDKERVKEEVFEMTEQHFEVVKYLISEKDWDYFQFVEIGLDRVHHAFWRYFDKEHHLYEKNEFSNVIKDYYRLLDKKIGELLKLVDEDTYIAIVSDHGVKRMKGAFAVNQWLMEEGLLHVDGTVKKGQKLGDVHVDWGRTEVWAWGGYYSRVFLNVEGRERKGIIKKEEYVEKREEVKEMFENIRGPEGEKWDTKIFFPEEIYPETKGDPSDLMVYFDDLHWRAAGTLGYESPYLLENDTGPDDAVHSELGVFLLHGEGINEKEVFASIYDFAPTILKLFGVKGEFKGRSLI